MLKIDTLFYSGNSAFQVLNSRGHLCLVVLLSMTKKYIAFYKNMIFCLVYAKIWFKGTLFNLLVDKWELYVKEKLLHDRREVKIIPDIS